MSIYYSITTSGDSADIFVFGDIAEPRKKEIEKRNGDVSGLSLPNDIKKLNVDKITVSINSRGGDVSEGLAIYNALRSHSAKIVTLCDGFACSSASIVFMAGDERIMNSASMLMIHNAWSIIAGNAQDMRKEADALDKIGEAVADAYMSGVSIPRSELDAMLDAETWITPQEALETGFATSISGLNQMNKAAADARISIMNLIKSGIDAKRANYAAPEASAETQEPEPDDAPPDDSAPEPDSPPDDPEQIEQPPAARDIAVRKLAAFLCAFQRK